MNEQRPSKELAKYLAHLAGCTRGALKGEESVTMRITLKDSEAIQTAADLLSAAHEPPAELSALRHFAEWAKGAKCDDEYAPRMVRHIASVAADVLEGVADIAGIGASEPPSGWQLIDTAPLPKNNNFSCIVAAPMHFKGGGRSVVGEATHIAHLEQWYWAQLDPTDGEPIYPTHWQPLPDAPGATVTKPESPEPGRSPSSGLSALPDAENIGQPSGETSGTL